MADLSARYATALFQLSQESGELGTLLNEAQFLYSALEKDNGISILTHPLISADEKQTFVDKVFEGRVRQDLTGFIRLTIAKNRENFLLPTLAKLVEMIKLHKNQITARVVSAVALNDVQKSQLSSKLSSKLGKEVDINVIIDPSQVAGISIHVDGYFLDCTIKTMLKNMKDSIASNLMLKGE